MDMRRYNKVKSIYEASIPNSVDFYSLRYEHKEIKRVITNNKLQDVEFIFDQGLQVTVINNGGIGYASTSNVSLMGVRSAIQRAKYLSSFGKKNYCLDFSKIQMPSVQGYFTDKNQHENLFEDNGFYSEVLSISSDLSRKKLISNVAIDLDVVEKTSILFSTEGSDLIKQEYSLNSEGIVNASNRRLHSQRSSQILFERAGLVQRHIDQIEDTLDVLANEACELLDAPPCPTGIKDIILMPSPMMYQIHETIGHALEMDRILGDESNYAGTSYITPEMFGKYSFGSHLLNVSFDPSVPTQMCSSVYDDVGSTSQKIQLIRSGVLEAGIGGVVSKSRLDIPMALNERCEGWSRPPIDRMANINLEAGSSSLEDMIESIEDGILIDQISSFSVDHIRQTFQFGCEIGRIIKNGELTHTVSAPSYRSTGPKLWHSLDMLGDLSTYELTGVNDCGKGEPGQAISVAHATPAAKFNDIEVSSNVLRKTRKKRS